jgi:hypothetical protein
VLGLWILLALLGLMTILALLTVEFWVRFHQEGLNGRVQYRLKVGPIAFAGAKEIGDFLKKGAKHPAEGQGAKAASADAKRAPPEQSIGIIGWWLPATHYFRQKVRFRRFNLFLEVGGLDAFESAMLAGLAWTVAGAVGSIISHYFVLPPGVYRVSVKPNWQDPALGVNLDCMLTFRVGHAIWAGVLLAPQALKSWRREKRKQNRRRQKGEGARG